MVTLIDTLTKTPAELRHPEKQNRPETAVLRKPDWLRVKAPGSGQYNETKAIVKATAFYDDPKVIAEASRGLGEAMVGINVSDLPAPHRLSERGW